MEGATHFILDFKDVYDNKQIISPVFPLCDLIYMIDGDNKYKDIAIWYIKPKVKTP